MHVWPQASPWWTAALCALSFASMGGSLASVHVLAADVALAEPQVHMVARVHPAPNRAGWNNTPVTVSFFCDETVPAGACPGPVNLADEGSNLIVTRSALRSTGENVWASATVNIDWTPPTVALVSPVDGSTTAGPSIAITASVADTMSGPSRAACNLADAPLADRAVSCAVALGKGRNAIIVQASDTAGNSASASIHAVRATTVEKISASPSWRTVTVRGESKLALSDDHGREVLGAEWSSSAPAIAEVVVKNGAATVFGRAAGKAMLTATRNGLSIGVTVVVVDMEARAPDDPFLLPPGSTFWSVPASTSDAVPVSQLDGRGPDLVLVDHTAAHTTLRFLHDGSELTRETIPSLRADAVTGDDFGGVLLSQNGTTKGGRPALGGGTMMRAGGGTGGSWVYRSDREFLSGPVLGLSGVISILESSSQDGPAMVDRGTTLTERPAWLVRIDGRTGRVLSRIELPMSRRCSGARCQLSPWVRGHPIGDMDGSTCLLVVTGQHDEELDRTLRSAEYSLQLLRIRPDGTATYRELAHGAARDGEMPRAWPTALAVNGDGRLLGVTLHAAGVPLWVIDDDSVSTMAMGSNVAIESVVADVEQTLIGTRVDDRGGRTTPFTTSFDADTLTQRWRVEGSPVVPADDGAIVEDGGDGHLRVIDGAGRALAAWVVPNVEFWGADTWLRSDADNVSAVIGPAADYALFTLR
jgi:hypothetical protein